MTSEQMVLVIVVVFFLFLLLGLPIAFVLLGISVLFLLLFSGTPQLYIVYAHGFKSFISDTFVAIPLFIFMAVVFVHSGIGAQMYDVLYKWFAGLRGGLLVGTIFMCTLIAAITGLTSTGILTIGVMGYPEMEKRGYSRFLTLGAIPVGGALGPIIPPSITMIIVAAFSEQSVGKMFMGGLVPGLVMAFLFIVYILVICWIRPSMGPALPPEERASWAEKLRALRGMILPVGIIALVLGTIYRGIATPTEAAGVGAAGALVSAAINRKFNFAMLKATCVDAFRLNALILWLILGGVAFAALMVLTGIIPVVEAFMLSLPFSPMGIIVVMMIIPLVLGMFMNSMPFIIVLLPVFIPIVYELGFDPLWFSVLFAINASIAVVTPPFGFDIFITKAIVAPDVTMEEVYAAITPFALIMILVLFIGVVWPPLITWLPAQMFAK